MRQARARSFALLLSSSLVAGLAFAGTAIDEVATMGSTVVAEVPAGGQPYVVGVLVPRGTLKGALTVKVAKGSALLPRVTLVSPDGMETDQDALAAAGAKLKATSKAVILKNLPEFTTTGLWRVIVEGTDGLDGEPTAGGFSLSLKGKPAKVFKPPLGTLANTQDTEDYVIDVAEFSTLTVAAKAAKITPFQPTVRVLSASGDEISSGPYTRTAKGVSVSVKKMPLPFFGKFTIRVGSTGGGGDFTLTAKIKAAKKAPLPVAGTPFADAGGPYVFEPGTQVALDGSGTTGAASYLWVPVSGPSFNLPNNKVQNPAFLAPGTRATYAWQLVGSNVAGPSLPSLAVAEIDRIPVADAGPSRIFTGAPVQLDGSGSSDGDVGDVLAYSWTQVSGPAASLDDPTSVQPTFTPSTPGVYVFALVVSDGIASSGPSTVIVASGAGFSAADAGRRVSVRPQDSVFLSGLRSRKGDGTAPTSWSWTASPGNPVAVTLAGANGPVASFTAPKQAANLRFRLSVDGDADHFDEVLVVVSPSLPENISPALTATAPASVAQGGTVALGAAAVDDGGVSNWEWMQADGPDAVLVNETAASASAVAPNADAVLRFLLMGHDGRKYGPPDAAVVVVGTQASPVARIGANVSGNPDALLTLTSAASSPAPGQGITARQWLQLSGRDWYDVAIRDPGFDPTAASPQVRVPTSVSSLSPFRALSFGLTVTDPTGTSLQDFVTVTFQNLPRNAPPSVNASTTAAIFRPGATVPLSASATDGDGDPLSFAWSQVSGPAAAITSPNLANASVTAPIATATLVFRVTVTDGTGEPNGTVTADVTFSVNRPPAVVASSTPAAGPSGTLVTLSGSGTTDPDDAGLSYAWSEIPPGSGSPVTLSGADTATATFTQPDYAGSVGARRRTFVLTVTDSMGPSDAVQVQVNFTPNRPPGTAGIAVQNDGRVFYSDSGASSDRTETLTADSLLDADGDTLVFTWSVESGPLTNASLLLSSTSGSSITFRSAPKPTASQNSTGGVYTVGVVASDGVELGGMGTVDLLVRPSFASDLYPMLSSTSCNQIGCHNATASGGLRLDLGASTTRGTYLVNVNGRVIPNDYASSKLFTQVNQGIMPQTGNKWVQWQINIIRDWIEPEWNVSPKPGLSVGAEDN